MSTRQLAAYGAEANRLGLRPTGAPKTESFISTYADRFRRAGLQNVHLEPAPMRRWLATGWSLKVNGATVPNTFYAPYTQQTGPSGVTAPMAYVPLGDVLNGSVSEIQTAVDAVNLHGKIAVFTVPYAPLDAAVFNALSYPGGPYVAPGETGRLVEPYRRPWLNLAGQFLDLATKAGAVGTIGIWSDLPGSWARQYTPYDGVLRPIPGLWVDSIHGAKVRQLADTGATATIVLTATVGNATTNNLIGFIPGRSRELTVLHTHTDGTNAMEENGPIGILAAAQYLARLPRTALDRTVMVFLSTGHFAGGVGIRHWLQQHAGDLVPRVSSLLTLEHLGCREFLPTANGSIGPTGRSELGAYFSPDSKGLVAAVEAAERRTGITGTVARPFLPAPTNFGTPRQPVGWPGEGTYFYWFGSLLDSNFITGPYGLISADLDTTGMVDYDLLRRKSMVAVRTILDLAATSTSDFQASAG